MSSANQNEVGDQLSINIENNSTEPVPHSYARTSADYVANDFEEPEETSLLLDDGQIKKKKVKWLSKLGDGTFKWKTVLKILLLIAFIGLIVVLAMVFHIQDHIKDVLKYIEKHREYGILIYIGVYTLCVWTFLPGSIISIAAGFLFKPLILAGAIIIVGDLLGAFGTFIFGRYIFSDWVRAQIAKRPTFLALNNVIVDEGWKIVLMLRLTPLPFNLISFFFSVSSIELIPFLWATALGVLPGTFNAVWIGSLVKSLSGIDRPKLHDKDIVIIAMNFTLVACCVICLSIFGKRSMRKSLMKLQASKESNPLLNQGAQTQTNASTSSENLIDEEPLLRSRSGFTSLEKKIIYIMLTVAFLDLAICVPLYFYFRSTEKK
ncbi:10356_t:CDS:2 [Ambispora leptoticha]|uniref:10356_t:CDS:1 n=1 Tax=Ambispora leptoticha TaxID=144679 RepID=A0A9N8ZCU7_9GLOM|nr:10356_t:CDS:2 [Ambispora leptoticha]